MLTAALSVFRILPIWAWAGAALLGWGAWQKHQATTSTRAAAAAEQRAAVESATAQAESTAREREHVITTKAQEASDAYRKNLATVSRGAAGLRTERDRLLDATAGAGAACAGPAASGATGRADGVAALRLVVRECTAALSEVAEAADTGDARLAGLQAYVRAIGAAPASAPASEP